MLSTIAIYVSSLRESFDKTLTVLHQTSLTTQGNWFVLICAITIHEAEPQICYLFGKRTECGGTEYGASNTMQPVFHNEVRAKEAETSIKDECEQRPYV